MSVKPAKMQVWNQYDEHALVAGLGHFTSDGKILEYVRYPNESNKHLRDRVYSANKYKGNATLQGMLDNITRDLNIPPASGLPILTRYNTINKRFFYLSEQPYPGPSGIRVYVSSSGTWNAVDEDTSSVRASGYANSVSGWIVWNQPDIDPTLIPSGLPGSLDWYINQGLSGLYSSNIQYGDYTQILEFIGSGIPDTNARVRVDYQVQNGVNIYGEPVINWRTDFSNPDDLLDTRFVGMKSEFPITASDYSTFKNNHISIFSLEQLTDPTISGYFYESNGKPTNKLVKLKQIINDQYPLQWGKFRLDVGRWDQLDEASIGEVPSFHDESLTPLSGLAIKGGSRYGIDLDLVDLQVQASGTRSTWYPVLVPGEFYIGTNRYYLFGKMESDNITLTALGNGVLSGNISTAASGVKGWPYPLGVISAYSSGRFFNDTDLTNNPYIKRLHDFTQPISGVYYRTPWLDYSSNLSPSGIGIDYSHSGFFFNYDTGVIFASGIDPTGFILTWEHQDVYTSGVLLVYSGGYGLNDYDFNPITNPFDRVLYIE